MRLLLTCAFISIGLAPRCQDRPSLLDSDSVRQRYVEFGEELFRNVAKAAKLDRPGDRKIIALHEIRLTDHDPRRIEFRNNLYSGFIVDSADSPTGLLKVYQAETGMLSGTYMFIRMDGGQPYFYQEVGYFDSTSRTKHYVTFYSEFRTRGNDSERKWQDPTVGSAHG